MSFEDEVLDLMRELRYDIDEYDVEAIFDDVDRHLPVDAYVEDMDRRTFRSIVERHIW